MFAHQARIRVECDAVEADDLTVLVEDGEHPDRLLHVPENTLECRQQYIRADDAAKEIAFVDGAA